MEGQPHEQLNQWLVSTGRLPPTAGFGNIGNTNSKYKYFYVRQCGAHVAYRTKAAVTLRPGTLECPCCDPNSTFYYSTRGRCKTVGQGEDRLWSMLDRSQPKLWWSAQDRVPGWTKGLVDACVYAPLERMLAIQVDGPTHHRACMSGKTLEQQAAIDKRFCDSVNDKGWSVLRLDTRHSDSQWDQALKAAINACQNAAAPPQVFSSALC